MHNHLFPALGFCLHVNIACYFEFVMLCFKLFLFLFWTNMKLIMFVFYFCVFAPVSLFSVFMGRCLLPNIQLLRDQPQSMLAWILIILSLLRQIWNTMTATKEPRLSWKGLSSWIPLRTLAYLQCSRKGRGQSSWIQLELYTRRS